MFEPVPVPPEYKRDAAFAFSLKLLRELGHHGTADWMEQTDKENSRLKLRIESFQKLCKHPAEWLSPIAGGEDEMPDGTPVERVLFECACGHQFEDYRRI